MPSLNEIRAGSAFVEISTRDSKLVAGLAKSARDIEKFGAAVRGIGLGVGLAGSAILAPLIYSAKQYAEHGENLSKNSAKTGASVEALSTLGYAASQTGTDADALTMGFAKMSKTLVAAAQGSMEAEQSLAMLGLSITDLKSMTQEDRFKLFADRIAAIQDPAERAAAAMKIFGRGGAELLPLLNQGSAGIEAMQAHARALGSEWSGADADAARTFAQTLKDLWTVAQNVTYSIGSAVAPAFSAMAKVITGGLLSARNWINEHKELFAIVAGGAAVLAVAGAAFVTLGTAIQVGGFALAGIGSALGIAVAAVGAIISPIGLVIGAIVGAGVALYEFTDIGASIGGIFVDIFKDIWTAIKFVFENTSTLAEAWGAAMTEAGLFVLQAWANISNSLTNLWITAKGYAVEIWTGIGSAIVGAAYGASDAFLKIWAATMHAWGSLVNATAETIQGVFLRTAQSQRDADIAQVKAQYEAPGSKMTPEDATKAITAINNTYDKYAGGQTQSNAKQDDAELDAKLAEIKKVADTRKQYLDDLRAKQAAAGAAETATARAENDKQLADAEATYKAAREAYEKEQKAKHGGGGNLLDNLADQFKSMIPPELLKKLEDLKAAGAGGDFTNTSKITASGTFNASAAFGFGGGDQVAKNTQKTAENTQSMYEQLRALNQKSGLLIFQ